jgi:hypothetical protein
MRKSPTTHNLIYTNKNIQQKLKVFNLFEQVEYVISIAFFLFLVYLFIYSYVGHFSLLPPAPASPAPASLPGRTVLPSSPILLKRRHKQ